MHASNGVWSLRFTFVVETASLRVADFSLRPLCTRISAGQCDSCLWSSSRKSVWTCSGVVRKVALVAYSGSFHVQARRFARVSFPRECGERERISHGGLEFDATQ